MSAPPERATVRWRALGTTAELVVTDGAALAAARAAVERQLAAYDLACSRFRDDSELAAVNAAGGRAIEVSRTFAHAVAVALRAARASDGLVDPTLGAELRAAGYDRDFQLLLEGEDTSASAGAGGERPRPPRVRVRLRAPTPAWRAVEVDELQGRVRVPAGVELDLGATAKALAADHAARAAHAATGVGVLVSLGGDVAVAGDPPDDGWIVRVGDDHAHAAPGEDQTIVVRAGGLATSGTTVRRWRAEGEQRHHLLDPRSGRCAASPWRTVSVAAGSCVDANTASTAALVRGDSAPAWLARLGLPARLVRADGEVVTVAGWPRAREALGC